MTTSPDTYPQPLSVYRCRNRAGNHRWVVAPGPLTAASYMVAAGMARKVENVKVVHAAADSSDTYLHDTRPTLMSSLDTIVHGDQVGHLIKQISDEPVWLLAVEEGWIKEGAVISVPRLPDIEAEAAQYGEEYEDENQEIREA